MTVDTKTREVAFMSDVDASWKFRIPEHGAESHCSSYLSTVGTATPPTLP